MLLRCSATFALVANRQNRGEEWAHAFPLVADRGREFFVRATAQLIDELHKDENFISALVYAEAGKLDQSALEQGMPACLSLLPPQGGATD